LTNVTFEIHAVKDGDVIEIPEGRLAECFEHYRAFLGTLKVLHGALVIAAEGQDPLYAVDELWAAVQNLCFTCPVEILETPRETFVYRFTSSADQIVVSAHGDNVRLLATDGADVTVPQRELFPPLYACGECFLRLLRDLKGSEDAIVLHLQPFADRARAALQAHGLVMS
jgi:hypothetical protein